MRGYGRGLSVYLKLAMRVRDSVVRKPNQPSRNGCGSA